MAFEVKFISSGRITAPHLKTPMFVEVYRSDDDDTKQFIDLTATHKTARLLCTDGNQFWTFGSVTVIDVMKELRDKVTRTASGRVKGRGLSAAALSKELAVDNMSATIYVPSIAGQPARAVGVILTPIKSSVRMELTEGNVEWLAKVVSAERGLGNKKHVSTPAATALKEMRDQDPTASSKLWVSASGHCRAVKSLDLASDSLSKKRTITYMKLDEQSNATETVAGALDFAYSDDRTPQKLGRPSRLTQKSLVQMFGAPSCSSSSVGETASNAGSDGF